MKEYKVVNDYIYFREMFSDTMGMNYHAAPVINRKPVGHKVLCDVNPSIFGNADIWKRVKILLEGIKKSNIPFLFSPEKIIVNNNQCQLVFEHFQGKNIEQMLKDVEKKGLSINFDLAMSMCIAIADIIELGSSIIVSGEKSFHGFLTPDNIMIHYDGKIALKNYGIFQYLERNEVLFGEIEKRYGSWLTPELLRKEKIVSQSDIYHLGYLLYRILTGKYFSCMPGEDFEAKFTNLTFSHLIPSTDKNFLTYLITFLKKTLNPNPLKRFLTIKELKDFIANYFHIEELSSITFNLAYFMNSLYGEGIEEEDKLCKQELVYVIPEPKKEPVAPQSQVKREDLVSGILDELDKRKKISPLIWAVVAIVAVAGAGIGYIYFSQAKKTEKLTAEKVKTEDQLRRNQQNELAKLINEQNEKIRQLEMLAATATEAQKKALELEKQRLDDLKKKKADELAKQRAEDDARKQLEAEQFQKDLEAQKAQEELKRKEEENLRQQEAERKRIEAARVKEGTQVALNEVTVKPEKISGKPPAINTSMRTKYRGQVMTIPTLILVDENGDVTKIKFLKSNVAADVQSLVEDTLSKWKYSPALKDNVKVKVWLTVAVRLTF
ncbi:MAG: protein kinase [Candidatus Aminicenantes bacterium]|nr:protein kinase [Candidatus Aminicenantes bacterium]